jgi:hypothetical protein
MKTQWQDYKSLELIPDSVPDPESISLTFANRIGEFWRQIFAPFSSTSVEEPYEYLERCLELDSSKLFSDKRSSPWYKFRTFFSDLFDCRISHSPEPEVWQSADSVGNLWWHVYDPMTGQSADLESEEEVQIWLEEHFR